MTQLPPITPAPDDNYVAFFLTLACNLKCPYCINLHEGGSRYKLAKRKQLAGEEWIAAANRLELRPDLPLTLQGGEPTLHPAFYDVVREVRPEIRMDLITNLTFDVERFIDAVPAWRFAREAPYAAIRATYHPGQNSIEDLIRKTARLQEAGFCVGLYGIEHPDQALRGHILEVKDRCLALGLDFRLKEFLGEYQGRMYGTFRYDGSVGAARRRACLCRTSEIIVDPGGYVFRCHSDLYQGRTPIAHILDVDFSASSIAHFRPCNEFGDCNPCDVKVKTNRYQQYGHTSVEIKDIAEELCATT